MLSLPFFISTYYIMTNTILILNFGSQHCNKVTLLLNKFESITHKIIHWQDFDALLSLNNSFNDILGIILSGSPAHLYNHNCPTVSSKIFNLKIPVLGICYGMQYIVKMFGGCVSAMTQGEFGKYDITLVNKSRLFEHLDSTISVQMRHYDMVSNVHSKFKILSSTQSCVAAIEYENEDTNEFVYGLQFHPEIMDNSDDHNIGYTIFKNFIDVCHYSNKK